MTKPLVVSVGGSFVFLLLVVASDVRAGNFTESIWKQSHAQYEESNAQSVVTDLPIHSEDKAELKSLKGPQKLIEGEYVTWEYPFRWIAASKDGTRLTLTQGMPLRFVEQTTDGYAVALDGVKYFLNRPRDSGALFQLQRISLIGVTADIVENRLGQPQKAIKDEIGSAFLYSKSITQARTAFDTLSSTTQGTIGTTPFQGSTTTMIPRGETMTYSPYCFVVHFDTSGIVVRITDIIEGTAKWKRD